MTAGRCAACAYTRAHALGFVHLGGVPFDGNRDIQGVDACLKPELNGLWDRGIRTVCSCCGHGDAGEAFIVVVPEDRQKMIDLGYAERPPVEDECRLCGATFRPKSAGLPWPVTREYGEGEGRDYMFDVRLITQSKSTACGPACLAMLLDYYGIEADVEALIAECNVGVSGASAGDLLRVGRAHGMPDFAAWSETPEDVLRQDRPGIIWWRFVHWIVFCGLNEAGDPVICNPARGRFALDRESFTSMCAGMTEGTCVCLANGEPQDLPEVSA